MSKVLFHGQYIMSVQISKWHLIDVKLPEYTDTYIIQYCILNEENDCKPWKVIKGFCEAWYHIKTLKDNDEYRMWSFNNEKLNDLYRAGKLFVVMWTDFLSSSHEKCELEEICKKSIDEFKNFLIKKDDEKDI